MVRILTGLLSLPLAFVSSTGEVDGAGEFGGPRVHQQERRVGLRRVTVGVGDARHAALPGSHPRAPFLPPEGRVPHGEA